jgi:hypothetical protein
MIQEELLSKSFIASMILSDLDSMSGSIGLKRAFGSQGLHPLVDSWRQA